MQQGLEIANKAHFLIAHMLSNHRLKSQAPEKGVFELRCNDLRRLQKS